MENKKNENLSMEELENVSGGECGVGDFQFEIGEEVWVWRDVKTAKWLKGMIVDRWYNELLGIRVANQYRTRELESGWEDGNCPEKDIRKKEWKDW